MENLASVYLGGRPSVSSEYLSRYSLPGLLVFRGCSLSALHPCTHIHPQWVEISTPDFVRVACHMENLASVYLGGRPSVSSEYLSRYSLPGLLVFRGCSLSALHPCTHIHPQWDGISTPEFVHVVSHMENLASVYTRTSSRIGV